MQQSQQNSQSPELSENLEATSKSKQLKNKILTETIKAKEATLKKIEAATISNTLKYHQSVTDTKAQKVESDRLIKFIAALNKGATSTAKVYKDKEKELKAKIAVLEEEIRSRSKYLSEQEEIISKSVENGNEVLQSLKYQITELDRIKQNIEKEIYVSKKDHEQIIMESTSELRLIAKAVEKSKEDLKTLTVQSEVIAKQNNEANERSKKIIDEVDEKLRQLKIKETSLLTKQRTNESREKELDQREKRISTTERLYAEV